MTEVPFAWGRRKGASKDGGVQFYSSFTYDGVNYSLYDHVLLFKGDLRNPFVGKLVKMWETSANKARRRIKVHWFFRPSEIASHLGDTSFESNELFLATGDGKGASNVNDLEAIGGKCIVLCTSRDERNPQPSQKDLKIADYVFSRTFDVQNLSISDKIGDSIHGVEAKFFFNREEVTPDVSVKEKENIKEPNRALEGGSNGAATQIEEKPLHVEVKSPLDLPQKKRSLDVCDDRLLKKAKLEDDQHAKAGPRHMPETEKDVSVTIGTSDEKIKKIAHKEAIEVDKKVRGNLKVDNKHNKLPGGSSTEPKPTSGGIKDSSEGNKRTLENLKLDNAQANRPAGPLKKSLPDSKPINGSKVTSDFAECSRRPENDKSKWFAETPWEIKIKNAYDQGKLVMLDNLDPEYSQSEIQDLIFEIFQQNCSVRLIEQSSFSNPHHGQAIVIFRTSEAANLAVQKLSKEILMLPNGRPVIARKGITRSPTRKSSAIAGMLTLGGGLKQRRFKEDQRKAAFSSHYSQANTVEFEMAVEWMLLYGKERSWWKVLHEANRKEISQVVKNLQRR